MYERQCCHLDFLGNWDEYMDVPGSIMCMVITYSKGKDQPGKIANPARGQLNREKCVFPVPVRA